MTEISVLFGDFRWSLIAAGEEAWYQSGNWPLIGAIAALATTNAVAIFIALYQAKANRAVAERLTVQAAVERSLAEFYDPLLCLLSENREVFLSFGPQRIASLNEDDAIVAAKVWSSLKADFIAPNNAKIADIIQTRSHLIVKEDSFSEYLKLKIHLDSYAIFQKVGSEVHEKFRFPEGIEERVLMFREKQVKTLSEMRRL